MNAREEKMDGERERAGRKEEPVGTEMVSVSI